MINEVKLRSTIAVDNMMPTTYDIGGKRRVLQSESEFYEASLNQKADFVWPKEMHIQFTGRTQERILTYETNEDGDPINEFNKGKLNTIRKFFMEHPSTLINGKPHANTIPGAAIYYDIVDVNVKVVSEFKDWENKHKVASHLALLDLDDLRNVAYYYGVLPKGKTRGTLILELADYHKGVLFSKPANGESKAENYIKVWMTNTDPDKEYIINCRKAIDLNVITTAVRDGHTTFYLGQEMLGPKLEDVVLFAKQNPDAYKSYILKGIKEKDQFLEEQAATVLESKSMKGNVTSNFVEEEKLRERVYSLYDEAFGLVGKYVAVAKNGIRQARMTKLKEFEASLTKQIDEEKKKLAETSEK